MIFLIKKENKNMMNIMLALSAGIMISASFFSLINPAIEIANTLNLITWFILSIGFLSGAIFLFWGDKIFNINQWKYKKSIMLFLSITLHNIPEGLVLGVGFASLTYIKTDLNSILPAITLTIGIALQNFPEGSSISLPLYREGISKKKAFYLGSLSAIVEPIFAVVGALLVLKIQSLLPFIMSFAAGAMIFVTIQELIPEIVQNKRKDMLSLLLMVGFTIMMILELIMG